MELRVTDMGGALLAETTGPINEEIKDLLRQKIHPVVAAPGAKVILDLSGSPRIDSQGLGHLVTLVAHANTNRSRVILCRVPPFIAVVIGMSKLDKFFELAETREEAFAKE